MTNTKRYYSCKCGQILVRYYIQGAWESHNCLDCDSALRSEISLLDHCYAQYNIIQEYKKENERLRELLKLSPEILEDK